MGWRERFTRAKDIARGLSEDYQNVKKARKSGHLRKECDEAKKHGTWKQKLAAHAMDATGVCGKKRKYGRRPK